MSGPGKNKDRNFKADYTCDICRKGDRKLWRDYQTFSDYLDLKCAICMTETSKKDYDDAGPFMFLSSHGSTDQYGGLVPAIPTDDGDTFWGYTSVPNEGIAWWYGLPTYPDHPDLEAKCNKILLQKFIKTANSYGQTVIEYSRTISDLRWKLKRTLYRVVKPFELTIWGTKTEKVDENHVLRYGDEMPHTVVVGDQIAVSGEERVFLVFDGKDELQKSPTVMHDNIGDWLHKGYIRLVRE